MFELFHYEENIMLWFIKYVYLDRTIGSWLDSYNGLGNGNYIKLIFFKKPNFQFIQMKDSWYQS